MRPNLQTGEPSWNKTDVAAVLHSDIYGASLPVSDFARD